MRCPQCGEDDDRVVDSRAADEGATVRRRRECAPCGARFTTFERAELAPIKVEKRNGVTVPYRPEKVERGVRAAGKGRLEEEQIADAVDAVERRLRQGAVKRRTARASSPVQVTTEQIGIAVLQELGARDMVAYVRFASVYENFQRPEDFEQVAQTLRKSRAPMSDAATADLVRQITGAGEPPREPPRDAPRREEPTPREVIINVDQFAQAAANANDY